jgi:hypothetical protein
VPSAVRHTRTVASALPLMMTRVPSASAPRRYRVYPRVAGQRFAERGAVGQPRYPHRAIETAADDDPGAVLERPRPPPRPPDRWPGEDLVTSSPAAVVPAGLPGPIRGSIRDQRGQAPAAQAVGGQTNSAHPTEST